MKVLDRSYGEGVVLLRCVLTESEDGYADLPL